MDFSTLIPTLERYGAPLIASLLTTAATAAGGPILGGIVGTLLKAVATELGAASAVPADIEARIAADPTKAQAVLPKVDSDHAGLIASAKAQAELDLANIQDARATEVQLVQAHSAMAWGPPVISCIVVGAFCLVALVVVYRYGIESAVGQLIVGALIAKFGTVVDYYLGASKGSSERVDQIVSMLHSAIGSPPAAKPRQGR